MYDKSKYLLHVSRSVRKDIHSLSLGCSSDVLAAALQIEMGEMAICLLSLNYELHHNHNWITTPCILKYN